MPNNEAQAATNATITNLWEFSEKEIAKREEKAQNEQQYLQQLKQASQQRGAFTPLQASHNDIPEIKKVKSKINQIVEKELIL